MLQLLFPLALLLSASLLFMIQPMAAKVLLPAFGGTPAVWAVCMFFFQALLLVAYAYVWAISRFRYGGLWRSVHIAVSLLSIFFLPLLFSPDSGTDIPEFSILKSLVMQLGLPLLVIGSSAPLLQYAFSQNQKIRSSDPYYLYAASNAGSLLALLSYPWLIERYFSVKQQFFAWNVAYALYLILLILLLTTSRYAPVIQTYSRAGTVSFAKKLWWIYLSFVPCSLMLGVTFYITTDIAATPLFWVLPLALYLLTYVITFSRKSFISHRWVQRNTLFILIFPIIGFIAGIHSLPGWQLIIAHLVTFFMLGLLFHGELARSRPPVSQLTTFYFCIASGGVLAGVFNSLLAPILFIHAEEYPLIILIALFGISMPRQNFQWGVPLLTILLLLINYYLPDQGWPHWIKSMHILEILALAMILIFANSSKTLFVSMSILFVFIFMPWFKTPTILSQQRNFYGVKQVYAQNGLHVFMSHSTLHGFQLIKNKQQKEYRGIEAYYGAVFPVVQYLQQIHPSLKTIIFGLGVGTMVCQFRKQDEITMVEIDPQVIEMANNPEFFTYLQDCPAKVSIIRDDGRLALTHMPDHAYNLLVMDAFSSDAIPVHLLTLEAFKLYQQKITENGVILANISNRHLNVLPVITAAGRELDMAVLHTRQNGNRKQGQLPSEWVLLTKNEETISSLLRDKNWRFVAENESLLWRDDYTNLIPILRW